MPKIVDHDERRSEIAQAVLRLVAREGVRGASLRSVAEEAGCSTGSIHHYCGDKQALLLVALREATRTVAQQMVSIQRLKSGDDRIQALLEAGMPLDGERAATCRIFYHLSAEGITDSQLGAELAGYYSEWRRAVRAAIEDAQRQARFASFDAALLADSLVGLAEGLGVQGMFDPATMNPERLRRSLAAVVGRLASVNGRQEGTAHGQ